jgi:16S rRNA G966 N2-methylase RsmD
MIELIRSNLRKYTFESPKIKDWVEQNSNGLVLNLFAGKTKLHLNEIRNDTDKTMLADFHLDAVDFILHWAKTDDRKFDTIILDPPYSYRKSMEMYNNNFNSRFKRVADELPKIIKQFTKIISFGYHSTFMGGKRGYKLERMCVFAHGGAQHCTIGIIEQLYNKSLESDQQG